MTKSNFVDSLPPGWTMVERIRGNGKRDKFYSAPNNGPTFNSRVQVHRYLSLHKPKNKNAKKRHSGQTWKLVGVEEVKVENLPRGWIGEIRVKESSETIRRDPYYTDPATKTKLRSLKAVYRYLKSREDSNRQSNQSGGGKSVADSSAMSGSDKSVNGQPETRRRSKRLAGIEVDNNTVGVKPKTRPRRHGDVIFEDLLSDPCIAFAVKVLVGPATVDDLLDKAESDSPAETRN